MSSAKRKFKSIKLDDDASAKAASASQDMSIHDPSTTTTPSPTPRQPHLLSLSNLILRGLIQDSLCLRTFPAQDHQTSFRHKALQLSSASGAVSDSRVLTPVPASAQALAKGATAPEPPAEAEQPAAAKQGEGPKASGKVAVEST